MNSFLCWCVREWIPLTSRNRFKITGTRAISSSVKFRCMRCTPTVASKSRRYSGTTFTLCLLPAHVALHEIVGFAKFEAMICFYVLVIFVCFFIKNKSNNITKDIHCYINITTPHNVIIHKKHFISS